MFFQTIVALAITLIASTVPVRAAIIFDDDFSVDPASNGWTELPGFHDIVSTGTQAHFDFLSSNFGSSTSSIQQTISTVGYTDIQFELSAGQAAFASFESTDFLSLEYSTNNGASFTTVFSDTAVLNDPISSIASPDGSPGSLAVVSTGLLPSLPAAANDNSQFVVRISVRSSHASEDYFIENFQITGDVIANAVPEPNTAMLLLLGGCFLSIKSRRSRMKS